MKKQSKRKVLYFGAWQVLHQVEETRLKAGTLCESCMEDTKRDLQTIFDNNRNYSTLEPLVMTFLRNEVKKLGIEPAKAKVEA